MKSESQFIIYNLFLSVLCMGVIFEVELEIQKYFCIKFEKPNLRWEGEGVVK